MPLNPLRNLRQTATVWATTPDAYGGNSFGAPYTVRCRWEDRNEIFVSPATGKEEVSRSVIYVESALAVKDYIALGDHLSVSDPTTIDSWAIRRFDSIPDLRNMVKVHKATI